MFYLINKPLGITSFDVIRKLRKLLNTKKIGHTGTLDPLASGCLLVATDNSTKLIPLLEKLEKTYTFKLRIDGTTPSLDLGTPVLPHSTLGMKAGDTINLVQFLEEQVLQVPPIYSALKVDGVRSYERARRGEDIELKERPIQIHDVVLRDYHPPEFTLSLRITSGGYIRSLAQSIGQFFGLPGGYITELSRDSLHLSEGALSLLDAQDLDLFDPNQHITYERLFPTIACIEVDSEASTKLMQGKILSPEEVSGTYTIGQKIFIKNKDFPLSLVEYSENGFQIIRNNV